MECVSGSWLIAAMVLGGIPPLAENWLLRKYGGRIPFSVKATGFRSCFCRRRTAGNPSVRPGEKTITRSKGGEVRMVIRFTYSHDMG